jgi:hypothetical protein
MLTVWGLAGMGTCAGKSVEGGSRPSEASGLSGVLSSSTPPKLNSLSLVIGLSRPVVAYFDR